MTARGIIRGTTIELDEPLPFAEGQAVQVQVEPAVSSRRGSPAAILEVMRNSPRVPREDVDELNRLIEEGKLPVSEGGIFDGGR